MMKDLATFGFVVACLAIFSEAIQLHRRTDGPPRVVGLPIERRIPGNGVLGSQLRRRDKSVQVPIENFMVSPSCT